MNTTIFIVLSIIFSILGVLVICETFRTKKRGYKYFIGTMTGATVVIVSYLFAALANDEFTVSVAMAVYFCANSVAIFFLTNYIYYYTRTRNLKINIISHTIVALCFIADIIIEISNPFTHIAVTFNHVSNDIAGWVFNPSIFYQLHLIFCYVLIAASVLMLVSKMIMTPKAYRRRYSTILFGLIVVTLVNAIYLSYQKSDKTALDYSVFLYAIVGTIIYFNAIAFSKKNLLHSVRKLILNELGLPVILFDEENIFVSANTLGRTLLEDDLDEDDMDIESFMKYHGFDDKIPSLDEDAHFQWHTRNENKQEVTYRVDYRVLKEKEKKIIGRMFVFTDTSLEIDVLTGFNSKNSFERYFQFNSSSASDTIHSIAICDLNKLSLINKWMGEATGDKVIAYLASLLVKYCPDNSYFARLDDANLLVVTPNIDGKAMRECLDKVRKDLNECSKFGTKLDMQSAISVTSRENPSILVATEIALFSMRSKKLMDGNSAHSSLLDSLAQTLKESDSTTEAHVARTREMGEMLGVRLGLTDVQLSNLALLCLLHDVGKLGVPLEILNKPSKLNDAEWAIMKSHVDKGYRIAKASKELEGIADYILHHHEAWNGRGYPDGLRQESIPLLSRIIAVVDSYDAMINDRPYHRGISEWEAREELRRCAGTQFDPVVVSEYLSLLEELRPVSQPKVEVEDDKEEITPMGVSIAMGEKKEIDDTEVKVIKTTKYFLDRDNYVVEVDDNFEDFTGYSKQDVKDYHLQQWDLIPAEYREGYMNMAAEELSKGGYANIEHPILRKDGAVRYVLCLGKKTFHATNTEAISEITVIDTASTNAMLAALERERETAFRNQQKWEESSRKDSLTGIFNHEAFVSEVEMQLMTSKNRTLLFVLDVDYFKGYNDKYGHLAGDKMLQLVARVLFDSVSENGFAGRIGGDEFAAAIELPDTSSKGEAVIREIAEELTNKVWGRITEVIGAVPESAAISLGATISSAENKTFSALYKAADEALYIVKEKGRNACHLK